MYHIGFAIVLFIIISQTIGDIGPQKKNIIIENRINGTSDNTKSPANAHQNAIKQRTNIPILKLKELHSDKYPYYKHVPKSVASNDDHADKNIHSKQEPTAISSNSSLVITNTTSNRIESANSKAKENRQEQASELESGAVTRGALVFAGVGFLFILYAAIKTYRGRRQDKSRTIVKYGIRTTHTDLEMEPLPLSDDEDDETLFDLNATKSRNR